MNFKGDRKNRITKNKETRQKNEQEHRQVHFKSSGQPFQQRKVQSVYERNESGNPYNREIAAGSSLYTAYNFISKMQQQSRNDQPDDIVQIRVLLSQRHPHHMKIF